MCPLFLPGSIANNAGAPPHSGARTIRTKLYRLKSRDRDEMNDRRNRRRRRSGNGLIDILNGLLTLLVIGLVVIGGFARG